MHKRGCTLWAAIGCESCKKLQDCDVVKAATLLAQLRTVK